MKDGGRLVRKELCARLIEIQRLLTNINEVISVDSGKSSCKNKIHATTVISYQRTQRRASMHKPRHDIHNNNNDHNYASINNQKHESNNNGMNSARSAQSIYDDIKSPNRIHQQDTSNVLHKRWLLLVRRIQCMPLQKLLALNSERVVEEFPADNFQSTPDCY